MSSADALPVLIGVGQHTHHLTGGEDDFSHNPTTLCVEAGRRALADAGDVDTIKALIDTLVVVRTTLDSVPGAPQPLGRCENPPRTVENLLGLSVERAVYTDVGGETPQALVNEFARETHEGRCKAAMLVGGEATAILRQALRRGSKPDWSFSVDGPMEDRKKDKLLLTDYELKNGLFFPPQSYPLFEHAYRARLGLSHAEYVKRMSRLFAPFSEVASRHPEAQFGEARSAEFLATPSKENYPVADPYLKWHIAQDSVSMGAAVIVTTAGAAKAAGVPEEKLIYLHGHARAEDKDVLERRDLSRSRVLEEVLGRTLEASNLKPDEIAHLDLYSCFPIVVELSAEILGIDPFSRPLTVTGGLPYFGGPGNNYPMHAIVSMAEALRADPGAYGLVLANGGFITKEAAGVYSTAPPQSWAPNDDAALQKRIDAEPSATLLSEDMEGEIRSFTVVHGKEGPQDGYVLVEGGGGRALARFRPGHRATMERVLKMDDPIGRTARVAHENGVNYYVDPEMAEAAMTSIFERELEFVKVEKDGHILTVTMNRPDSMNSLHAAAHRELADVWDAFEADQELWVAVLTGAGERAFSAGNDLKATAQGGDISTPASGFGGLTMRFDREKPIIAAVNGVAMGGGLEIALCCDIVIAEAHAKLALPEVKVGLFAAAGGVQRLSRQIGRKAAMELILTGRHISAERGAELGIVNSVVGSGEGLAAATALAQEICSVSPSAVRASKKVLNGLDALERAEEAMKLSGPVIGDLMKTNDLREGVTAFAEKRAPKWTNS